MTRSDWHVLGLAAFFSPLVVTGVGAAISRGHSEVAIVAVAMVGVLVAYLSRRRLRGPRHEDAEQPHDHRRLDAGAGAPR